MPRFVLIVCCLLPAFTFAGCSGDPPPAPVQSSQSSAPARLVIAEQDGGTTLFSAVNPNEPVDRRVLARVEHDPNWGVRASISVDGRRLAYLVVPHPSRDADDSATLVVADLATQTRRTLATGLDLRIVPQWIDEDRSVLVQRRSPSGAGALVAVGLDRSERVVVAAQPGHRLFPAAVSIDGRSVYVLDQSTGDSRIFLTGSDGITEIASFGSTAIRGFVLSPAGDQLAFLQLSGEGTAARYHAGVVDIRSGSRTAVRPEQSRLEDTGVAWADGWIVSATYPDGRAVNLGPEAARDSTPPAGFDVLDAQVARGGWVTARAVESGDSLAPGPEQMVVLNRDGRRTLVSSAHGASAIGWSSQ